MSSSTADPGQVAPDSGRSWVVAGYTEVRTLGGGAFGEVVLATHDATGNPVAIKYLHPDLLGDPDQVAGFRAEARTLAGLDSPHVVRLYEYVAGPAGAAIVMELVEGVTLAKIIEHQGKTTPEAALVVLFGSLLGLAAAHAKGVVHRDYKPANVLIDGQGASKLTDFGIAALAGGRPMPAGTLRYMPPEQFEGAAASPAADVYAATVTFYQCLAGRVPFDGETVTELYDMHRSSEVPMDPVPEPLRPVIARGMAKDPRSRPADAGLLAAELRDVAAGAFGADWADRGRSHLTEAALLLLALLWPSGSAPAVGGTTVAKTALTEPPAQPAQNAATGQAQPAQAQPAQAQPQPAQPQPQPNSQLTEAARHAAHVQHAEHEEHLAHLHAEHEEHLEHLARLRAERPADGDGKESAKRGERPRPRFHPAVVAGAVAAVVVIGAVAAFAAGGHHSTLPPSGAPNPGTSTAGPGGPPSAVTLGGGTTAAGTATAAATASGGSGTTTSPASFPLRWPTDMTAACVQQYGQGTHAEFVQASPPSYSGACTNGSANLGPIDLDRFCPLIAQRDHYVSPNGGWWAGNPERYDENFSDQPWTDWRCYNNSNAP